MNEWAGAAAITKLANFFKYMDYNIAESTREAGKASTRRKMLKKMNFRNPLRQKWWKK